MYYQEGQQSDYCIGMNDDSQKLQTNTSVLEAEGADYENDESDYR
mgnify:CR=1 FL=1